MSRPVGVPCKVIWSPDFETQARAIEPDYKRLDDMLTGAQWVIARAPYRGQVEVTLNPGGGLPKLVITADIDEIEAVMREVRVAP